jgi:hypothetical protein
VYEHQKAFQVGVARDAVTLHHAGGRMTVDVEELEPSAVGHEGMAALHAEAVGYSKAFDFNEAFRDAIGKIPVPPIPDWLATYTVLDIGAEIGGIAGFNRMFVRVRGG